MINVKQCVILSQFHRNKEKTLRNKLFKATTVQHDSVFVFPLICMLKKNWFTAFTCSIICIVLSFTFLTKPVYANPLTEVTVNYLKAVEIEEDSTGADEIYLIVKDSKGRQIATWGSEDNPIDFKPGDIKGSESPGLTKANTNSSDVVLEVWEEDDAVLGGGDDLLGRVKVSLDPNVCTDKDKSIVSVASFKGSDTQITALLNTYRDIGIKVGVAELPAASGFVEYMIKYLIKNEYVRGEFTIEKLKEAVESDMPVLKTAGDVATFIFNTTASELGGITATYVLAVIDYTLSGAQQKTIEDLGWLYEAVVTQECFDKNKGRRKYLKEELRRTEANYNSLKGYFGPEVKYDGKKVVIGDNKAPGYGWYSEDLKEKFRSDIEKFKEELNSLEY